MSRFFAIVLGMFLCGCVVFGNTLAHGQIDRIPRLVAPAGADDDTFGSSVAISGDTAVIGARNDDAGANINQGSVTVYRWSGSAWVFEATLFASDGAANDYFGTSVAIEGDTIIVGAPGDNVGLNAEQGSAYAFERIDGVWDQRKKLVASDGAAFDTFGISVSFSGQVAVIGAEGDDIGANANQGSAYIFVSPTETTTEQGKLIADDGAANDLFGGCVSVSGDSVVVGSRGDDVGVKTNEGSVYVFTRSGWTWSRQAKLNASDGKANDFFGDSVSISGDTLAVGAFNDDVGSNARQGSATIFTRSSTTWSQQANLTDLSGAADDVFGTAVAISGDTLVVGAQSDDMWNHVDNGSACVFVRSGSTWLQQAKYFYRETGAAFGASVATSGEWILVGAPAGFTNDKGFVMSYRRAGQSWNTPTFFSGEEAIDSNDQLGSSVAMENRFVVVGVPHDDDFGGTDSGSIYIFEKSAGEIAPFSWDDYSVTAHKASDAAAGDNFGVRVSMSGGTILASAANKTVGGATQRGAAYIFEKGADGWGQRGATLLASDGAANDNFGISTALRGDVAVIGAFGKDTGGILNHGAAYVFERSGGFFVQTAKLVLPALAAGDFFGNAVEAERDLIAVAAYNKQFGANASQGAVYLFVRDGPSWKLDAGLVASDGAPGDCFGISLALDGETLAVGAFNKTVNGAAGRGAVYIFARTLSGWTQTARIIAPDGAAGDAFGWQVDLSGGKLAIGAPNRDTAGRTNSGAVYVFASASGLAQGPWMEVQRITRTLPGADDSLGGAVAIFGSSVISGMSGADFSFGANNYVNAGGALLQDTSTSLFISAFNASTNTQYPSLDAAMASASSGHTVIGSAGAFYGANPDFAGRAISLRSLSNIALPAGSTTRLDRGSELRAAADSDIAIGGNILLSNDSGRSQFFARAFALGATGSMTLDNHELVINAPAAALDGFVNLRSASSVLTATGSLSSAGVLNSTSGKISTGGGLSLSGSPNLLNSTISAGGPVTINATNAVLTQVTLLAPSLAITGGKATIGGTISAPITNSGTILTANTTTIYGSITNNSGAFIRLTGGTTALYGSISGAGTLVGSFTGCPTCLSDPNVLSIENDLTLDPGAFLSITGGAIEIGGNFDLRFIDSHDLGMAESTIRMSGIGTRLQTFEVMSKDRGPIASGLSGSPEHSFPLGTLEVGPIPTTVTLTDSRDNDGVGQTIREALYIETLVIGSGSRLNTAGFKVYCRNAAIDGSVDNPANIIALGGDCPTDLNADGRTDDADFVSFLEAYDTLDCADPLMPAGCPANFNSDTFVNDADFLLFVVAYDALVCP